MNTARTGLSRSPGYSGKPVKVARLPGCLSETTQCCVLCGQFVGTYQGAILAAGFYLRERANKGECLKHRGSLFVGFWFGLVCFSVLKIKMISQEAEAISGKERCIHKTIANQRWTHKAVVNRESLGSWPHRGAQQKQPLLFAKLVKHWA